jgi:hypothetical protein
MDPQTQAPAVLQTIAEVMFLIKISPLECDRYKDIICDAINKVGAKWSSFLDGKNCYRL